MKRLMMLMVMLALVCLAAPVYAGPWEEGTEAYVNKDYGTAMRLLRPLAEQGKAMAQFTVGSMYYNGDGVPKDYKKAVHWLTKAAEQGESLAQGAIGKLYFHGRGVPKDDKKAFYWLSKAAEQGNHDAQLGLGFIYLKGRAVPPDYVKAYMWTNLAAAGNDAQTTELAKELLTSLEAKMTPQRIVEAQRLSSEWRPKTP